jgi:large subunit ribosomal protein L21e
MAKRIGGNRRKTRTKFKKPKGEKGKISITKYFQELKQGDKVILKAEPAVQKGIYYRRFHGKTGLVKAKRGTCYEVEIKDFNKTKTILVHPVHLQK